MMPTTKLKDKKPRNLAYLAITDKKYM